MYHCDSAYIVCFALNEFGLKTTADLLAMTSSRYVCCYVGGSELDSNVNPCQGDNIRLKRYVNWFRGAGNV